MNRTRLIVLLCSAEILGMLSFATFPALLPTFFREWNLSNTEAGWINGIYYAGYLLAVPVLVALTDRVDPKKIYLFATMLAFVAAAGFAVAADGFWSAMALRGLAGIGLAGTYMPGLKALTDRITGPLQSRAVAFYTGSFSIGSSLSFFAAGEISVALDWRWAFGLAALGPLAAIGLVAVLLPASRPMPVAHATRLLDFRPVLRNRPVMGFVLAYMFHNCELFGMRSWLVAFLAFSAALQAPGATVWSATTVAALINLLGLVGGVAGNELALRIGRRRFVIVAMLVSALVSLSFGLSAPLPYVLVVALAAVYGFTVSWDSSAITAGVVAAADPALRGATMAVQSSLGFVGAFLAPLAFGIVLDAAGGNEQPLAWTLAFALLAVAVAMGPLAILGLRAARAPD
ncbi:MAG: MFS transporter [Rhodospirillales bacterium]|nr:MFS transporter [Rhodospirillales bacterium]